MVHVHEARDARPWAPHAPLGVQVVVAVVGQVAPAEARLTKYHY